MSQMSQSNILQSMQINQALKPAIYQEISRALLNLVHAQTQEDVQSCSKTFNSYQNEDGYIIYLLEIINNNLPHVAVALNEDLVSSAFTQLKNIVRKNWKGANKQLCMIDRECLKNSIIRTSFNISSVQAQNHYYRYMKLLKDVISTTYEDAAYLCPDLVDSVAKTCQSGSVLSLLPVYINIMLGVSHVLIFQTKDHLYRLYSDMIKQVHPYLYQFAINGNDIVHQLYNDIAENYNQNGKQKLENYYNFKRKYQEILYLSLKLFSKAIRGRYSEEFREIALDWMSIAQRRVEYIDPAFTHSHNSDIDYSPNSMGYKGDDKFNYFHGKKWGLKFFSRVMTKILLPNPAYQMAEASRLQIEFYAKNFDFFIEFFRNIWSHQWPQRVLCELLSCLYNFMERKKQKIGKQHLDLLRYFIGMMLPPLIRITQKEVSIIEQYPPQFIERESNIGREVSDVRTAATMAWLKATSIEFFFKRTQGRIKNRKDSYGMELIVSWLSPYNPETLEMRDVGCFLLVRIKEMISHQNWLEQDLNSLINQVVAQNLQYSQGNYLTLARTLQIFTQYKKVIKADVIAQIKETVLSMYNRYDPESDLRQQQAFVLLRGGQALQKIILYEQELEVQELKMVISKVFMLIKATCFEEFMTIANRILVGCFRDLDDCVTQIARFVQSWFEQFVERDRYQIAHQAVLDYKDSYFNMAKGTLEIYQTFIYFVKNGNRAITEVIEKEILSIIHYLFCNLGTIDEQYNRQALSLLNSFLSGSQENKPPSKAIFNLCRKILLKIAGIPRAIIKKLQIKRKNNPTPKNLEIIDMYLTCEGVLRTELKDYVGVVSQFIQYFKFGEAVRPYDKIVDNLLHSETNNTEYLVYLAYTFHRKSRKDLKLEQGKCFSMLMLIFYYQHYLKSNCDARVHKTVNDFTIRIIIDTIHMYENRPLFAKYNVQLFCLWLYEVKEGFKEYFSSMPQENVRQFFSNIFIHQATDGFFGITQLELEQQILRVVLGISTFINILANEVTFREFLGYELVADIITEAIHMTHSNAVDTDEKSSTGYSAEDEGEDEITKYHKLLESIRESEANQPRSEQKEDEVNYQQQVQYEEENSSDGVEQEYEQDDFSEREPYQVLEEESRDEVPKMPCIDEKLILLKSLHNFLMNAGVWYWRIMVKEGNRNKIADLLGDCGALKDQKNRHLIQLVGDWQQEEQ